MVGTEARLQYIVATTLLIVGQFAGYPSSHLIVYLSTTSTAPSIADAFASSKAAVVTAANQCSQVLPVSQSFSRLFVMRRIVPKRFRYWFALGNSSN